MRDTRDRLLDAVETLLLSSGPAAATLEAVAAEAGVSKGGLLYHFASKQDLFRGLLDRLETAADDDLAAMREDPRGAVAAYLDSSREAQDAYTRTLLAALRLVGAKELAPTEALARSLETFFTGLSEQIPDPVLARLVQLVGDGLYLHALVGAPREPLDSRVVERVLELVASPSA